MIHYDVLKTIKAFQKLGIKPIAWRTHVYEGNEYLYYLLAKSGFKMVSDCRAETFKIFKEGDILNVCINMPVDDGLGNKPYVERSEWYERYLRLLDIKAK